MKLQQEQNYTMAKERTALKQLQLCFGMQMWKLASAHGSALRGRSSGGKGWGGMRDGRAGKQRARASFSYWIAYDRSLFLLCRAYEHETSISQQIDNHNHEPNGHNTHDHINAASHDVPSVEHTTTARTAMHHETMQLSQTTVTD